MDDRVDPPITVAVVAWNTRELLIRCLDSLRGDFEAGRAAVVVVDNGSTDGSREAVRSDFGWVKLLEPDENLGFGRAVNAAAEYNTSPWLAAANADVELTPGALETLLHVGETHPDVGAVAPRLLLPNESTQHSVHCFPSPGLALFFGLGIYRVSQRIGDRFCIDGYWNPDRPRKVDWAHGAFLLIRRASFDRVGGFDEAQWLYAEETDLAWRMARAGHTVYYEPRAVVRHSVSASTRQAFGEWERDRRRNVAAYSWLARRRGIAVARLTALINLAGAAVRLLIFSPLAVLAPRRWTRARDRSRRYVALHRRGLTAQASPGETA